MAEHKQPEQPDWDSLLSDPVVEVQHNQSGYANDTWIVRTEKRSYVVKATRAAADPRPDRPFWDGMYTLFGVNPYGHLQQRRALADFIRQHSPLEVPHTIHIDASQSVYPRPFIIDEKLPGEPADLDPTTSPFDVLALARQLGEHLGSLHAVAFNFWGSYPISPSFRLQDWPELLAKALENMTPHWFEDQPQVMRALPDFAARARRLPALASAALIFPDLHPGQFLVHDGRLAALVDIESHVLGPRELDFIALEYALQPRHLPAFREGYTRHLPLPDLAPVRALYRYLYWVMSALGAEDYREWMEQAPLF